MEETGILNLKIKYFMKHFLLFASFFVFINAFSQNWLYTSQVSGINENSVYSICKDTSNNVYFFGRFIDTAYVGTIGLKSTGGNDIIIGKVDDSGNPLWLKKAGSDMDDLFIGCGGISINQNENCIYITGTFQDTCQFESTTLISDGGYDMFIAKYALNGNFVWAKKIGWGLNGQVPFGIDVDINGDVVVDGFFQNSIDLEGGISLIASGGATTNNFIAKYNNNGVLYWARKISQSAAGSRMKQISSDSTGYYFNGYYTGNINLDIFSINSVGSTDMFVYKTDFDGNGLWVRKIFGAGQETGQGIIADKNGKIYAGGYFQSAALTVDSTETQVSSATLSTAGNNDLLIVKYNSDGTLQWAKKFGSTASDVVYSIDALNNKVVVTGGYNAAISFGSYNLTFSGSTDAYLLNLDTSGTVQNALKIGANLAEFGWSAVVDYDDNMVVAGDFTSASLTIGSTTINNVGTPNKDVFISKYGCPKVTPSFATDSVTCPSGNDGTATVTPSGMTSYLWSTTSTSETITNLTAGTYKVTITGLYGCKYIDSVEVAEIPGLSTSMSAASYVIDCAAGTNGLGIVSAADGKPAYSYLWDNGITNDTAINLTVGVHYVSVTDGCGFKKDSIEITSRPALVAGLNKHAELLICASYTNGEVTVQTTNGVGPFTYTWDDMVAPSATRNDLDTGWHYVTVTDICNVPNKDSIRVNYLPEVNVNITSSTAASCPLGGDGYAFALASSGVPPYSYQWSNSASTENEASDLITGWQYVTVTDFCKTAKDSILVTNNPVVTSAVTLISKVTCTGLNNGSATVTPSLGLAPYTYLWSTAETNATASALIEGWNYVTVTDACTSTRKDSVFLTIESALTESVTLNSPASCPASNNGSATAAVITGVPAYTYLWDNGNTNANATDLTVGWHKVTITDGCGPKVDSIQVTNMPLLSVSLSTTNILLTCATDLGTVTVLTQNGVAPFTYTWDDMLAPSATRNDLDTGWHYVTVTDVCNNPFTGSVRVNHLPEVTTSIVSSAAASCPAGGDGQATVEASSGVPSYSYIWSNSVSTSATASDLLTGWQYVTVSDFCISRVDSVLIVSNPTLQTIISSSAPTNCSGAFNGSATVTASNGGGSYTYLWTSSETNASAIALGEGWNYVTVTDLCGTVKVDSVNISVQSALVETVAQTTQASCPTSSDGVATVTVTSGVAPYTYTWESGGSAATEPGLGVGWHYVTINDGCGPKVDSVEITNKPLLQVTLSAQSVLLTCGSDLGTVTVLTQDGVAPFTYTWDDGVYVNPTRAIDTGWHYVTVTDICNNPFYDTVRVNFLPEVMIDYVEGQPASCPSGGNGYAFVLAESGVPPYSYTWSNSTSNSNTANDLLTGWQYVTVTDYCTSKVDSVEIESLPLLEAIITDSTNVSCPGGINGTATVLASNGGSPYTYLWTSGETTAIADSLQSGWSFVTVTDFCGTTIIDSVELFLNQSLSITSVQFSPTSCDGGNNGSATVNYTGGSAPISFIWSDPLAQTTQTATGLTNDTVYVTVTDACGSQSSSTVVGYLPLLSIAITANLPASCPTSTDGKAFVTATDGSGAYTYLWSNSSSTAPTATDLPVGWNYVTVSDACGSQVDSVQIGNKPLLSGTVTNTIAATCPDSSDGVATVTPVDGVAPYSYAWSGSADIDSVASDLAVGVNYVTITDICGSVVLNVTVSALPALTYSATTTNLLCFQDSTGSIELLPSLGVPPYSYFWGDTTLTDSVRTGLSAGTYTVTISDVCGSAIQNYTITQPGNLSISLLSTNVQFQGETTGKIDLIVSGGSAPYYYEWSNASLLEDQTDLGEGYYSVTVSDINNCDAVDSVEIISLMKHIVIYDAFTPNADGKNDVWNIKYINNFPECEVHIYNEWGVEVFQSTGYETPWDGTKDGKPLPAASYYFVIDLKDGSEAYTGSVTLMK